MWDTFSFFELMLEHFRAAREGRPSITSKNPIRADFMATAKLGYDLLEPSNFWDDRLNGFIATRLDGDLSLEALAWYEEGAPIASHFACFVIGGLLAIYNRGDIDDQGFALADVHLPAFMLEHDVQICTPLNITN